MNCDICGAGEEFLYRECDGMLAVPDSAHGDAEREYRGCSDECQGRVLCASCGDELGIWPKT